MSKTRRETIIDGLVEQVAKLKQSDNFPQDVLDDADYETAIEKVISYNSAIDDVVRLLNSKFPTCADCCRKLHLDEIKDGLCIDCVRQWQEKTAKVYDEL